VLAVQRHEVAMFHLVLLHHLLGHLMAVVVREQMTRNRAQSVGQVVAVEMRLAQVEQQ
jgi:hypothetical protein